MPGVLLFSTHAPVTCLGMLHPPWAFRPLYAERVRHVRQAPLVLTLGLLGCRNLLGIEDLSEPVRGDAGGSALGSGGRNSDSIGQGGADGTGGQPLAIDREWARWKVRSSGIEPEDLSDLDGYTTDAKTGLSWPDKPLGDATSWEDAPAACSNLDLGEHKDWRVPTRIELASILDYAETAPALSQNRFFDFPMQPVLWTATLLGANTTRAWTARMLEGTFLDELRDEVHLVWCTRGPDKPAPEQRFVPTDQAIIDTVTGLIWQRHAGAAQSLEQAKKTCKLLSIDDATGPWRVPGLPELHTIVDVRRSNPALDPMFEGEGYFDTWSNTPEAGALSASWMIEFASAIPFARPNAESHAVRCVR